MNHSVYTCVVSKNSSYVNAWRPALIQNRKLLDLAVRNVSAEWRNEFRRLVERDKRSGNGGTLPFKLALPQMATTFVEYAQEIGRDPPGS